ncbi:transglutaminase [Psychrobacillus glaciei]|uniref:Transglutaminase n=1 Tax=Psychrobacillus glaciei TaxID=2283160 RepID=A0A5J6SS26_9BACI|nr:transglutaminase-like domain-containing protein [Psychrobacillus glaciei]QFG00304.1 transglutaminase [Psychrobacillus glaciei]
MIKDTPKSFLSFIIYIFVYILIVEWLKPVIELTDTDYLKVFCLFLVISFLFYFMKVSWRIVIPAKVVFISWVLIYLYTDLAFFSKDSIFYLLNMLWGNLNALMSQDWLEVTDAFRTLLFFILLWMTTYLLNYWIRVRKNVMLFFLLTVLFITILDTFSPYNGEKSIVIVLVAGFMLSGLLFAQKVMSENKVQINGKFLLGMVASLFGLIAVSGVIAYALPKAGPSWPDPVPFLTSTSPTATEGKKGGANIISKVGYGENDEKLGGAFLSDDTPVFYATVPRKQYWKVETKDTYTTKGWIQSEIDPQITNYEIGEPITSDIMPGNEDKEAVANITMAQEFDFIMQPYGIKSVHTEPVTLSLNKTNQKISTFLDGSTISLDYYEPSYSEPVYSLKALRGTTIESLTGLTSEFDRYLQLPEKLPTRVSDLAISITENRDSLYEKVKAIERYFSRNGFRYDQMLAAVPKGNTDYVDQFLFDTKMGYCDNFSTSMVVMLRTLGIPSRWVKGFASGENVQKGDSIPVFKVTNNDAHSWVEAYFPGVGWMYFEPTIGFSNSANLEYDLNTGTSDTNTPVPPVQKQPVKEKPKTEKADVSKGFTEVLSNVAKWVSDRKVGIIWTLVGVFVFSLIAYQYRRKWISKVLIPVYRMRKDDWETFEKMYLQLLKQLNLYGLAREQGQTLSAYAKKVDTDFGGNHMKKLTSFYEKGIYGGNRESIDYKQMRESWENLINQLSG